MNAENTHPVALASELADALEAAVQQLRDEAYGPAGGTLDAALALAHRLRNVEVGRWLAEQTPTERPRRAARSRRSRP